MSEVLGKLWLWATCVGRAVPIPIAFSAEQEWGQGCELEPEVPDTGEGAFTLASGLAVTTVPQMFVSLCEACAHNILC